MKTSSSHFDGFTYLVCIFTKLIFMILAYIYFILLFYFTILFIVIALLQFNLVGRVGRLVAFI